MPDSFPIIALSIATVALEIRRCDMAKVLSYSEKEKVCLFNFNDAQRRYGNFWHLCTPGSLSEIINISEEDFKFSVSNAAISAYEAGMVVITDAHMENHLHSLLAGSREGCILFLDNYRFRLSKHLMQTGRYVCLSSFKCDNPILITDLEMMRNEIAYINRNGFVADSRYLPYSYPWSGSCLYFNPYAQRESGTPYNELPFREKRLMCCRRVAEMPSEYVVKYGMIIPGSYVNYRLGQSMFRDAHHYYNTITRNVEAFSAVSKRLGDSIVLAREEMYPVVKMICEKDYSIKQPSMLPPEAKLDVARKMHFDYHATNAQIRMILKIDEKLVDSLFP